jgi:predicted nuclease with TOPRIM domain
MGDELRKEMDDKFATKKSLGDLKSNTDTEFAGVKRRIDALEAEQNRIAEKTAKMN